MIQKIVLLKPIETKSYLAISIIQNNIYKMAVLWSKFCFLEHKTYSCGSNAEVFKSVNSTNLV